MFQSAYPHVCPVEEIVGSAVLKGLDAMTNQTARVVKQSVITVLLVLGTALVSDLLRHRGWDQPMLMPGVWLMVGIVLGRLWRREPKR